MLTLDTYSTLWSVHIIWHDDVINTGIIVTQFLHFKFVYSTTKDDSGKEMKRDFSLRRDLILIISTNELINSLLVVAPNVLNFVAEISLSLHFLFILFYFVVSESWNLLQTRILNAQCTHSRESEIISCKLLKLILRNFARINLQSSPSYKAQWVRFEWGIASSK